MRLLLALLPALWAGNSLGAAELAGQTADQRIEALLVQVLAQPDVQFIRNGTPYDAATAVKFLRAKWDRQRAAIRTVHDFIDQVATKSSTTGQPYLIRFKDGRTVACRDFLTRLLTET